MDKLTHLINVWFARNGDETLWSWIITFTYLITIIISFLYLKRLKGRDELKEERFLWIVLSLFILAMGINKQLDIQILLIMIGGYSTRVLGIREYRYAIYATVFLIIFLTFLGGGIFILIKARRVIGRNLLALGGSGLLALFVLIRILSLPVYRVHGMELAGLIFILGNLGLNCRRMRAVSWADGAAGDRGDCLD